MTGFRKSLAISAALHAGLLAATLIAFTAPAPHRTDSIDHIPLEMVEDISEDAQRAGEQNQQRTETPQARETPQPSPRPDPTPVPPPERPRPVDPSSAPAAPPPPTEQAAEPPRPAPVPLPPQRPPEPQVARTEEPPDEEGMLRRLEEDRRQEQQRQQEEQRRREEQRRQEQARREEQRRQEQARREEQRRREEARRRQEEQRRQQAQAAPFDPQRISDILNRQEGAPQPQAQQGPTRTASLGNPRGRGQRLTQSQMALLAGMIRDQIAPCWSPPPGPQGTGRGNVVRIELLMNRDGSFSARPRVMNASSEPGFRPLADSAVRAIMNCANRQGGKLNLPAEMYDVPNGWREIEFAFDPSQMS